MFYWSTTEIVTATGIHSDQFEFHKQNCLICGLIGIVTHVITIDFEWKRKHIYILWSCQMNRIKTKWIKKCGQKNAPMSRAKRDNNTSESGIQVNLPLWTVPLLTVENSNIALALILTFSTSLYFMCSSLFHQINGGSVFGTSQSEQGNCTTNKHLTPLNRSCVSACQCFCVCVCIIYCER